jgi:hypothetical protein
VCDPGSAEVFKNTALWLILGENDPYFNEGQVNEMYVALTKISLSDVRFSLLKGKGHDVYRFILNNNEFMDWMFSQAKD